VGFPQESFVEADIREGGKGGGLENGKHVIAYRGGGDKKTNMAISPCVTRSRYTLLVRQ
jgi:hypothetical protein